MSGLEKILGSLLGGKDKGGGGAGGLDLTNIIASLGGARSTQGGGGLNPALLGALLPLVAGLLKNGGLEKILGGLKAKGFTSQADSWVGTGDNEPVSGADIKDIVGQEEVSKIAAEAGLSEDEAAEGIATLLPQVVDHASPEGQLAPAEDFDGAFDQLLKGLS